MTGSNPSLPSLSSAQRTSANSSRTMSPRRYAKREPERRAPRSMSMRSPASSRWSRAAAREGSADGVRLRAKQLEVEHSRLLAGAGDQLSARNLLALEAAVFLQELRNVGGVLTDCDVLGHHRARISAVADRVEHIGRA